MWRQAKLKPYQEFDFFPDRQASRPLVPNTVARGKIKTDDPAYFTGKLSGKPIKTIPVRAVQAFESPKAMLLRGKDRFDAYCTPCHGKTGNGNGFIMQRGLGNWQKLAASFHDERLRKTEDGHIYDVLTNGIGVMYGYASRIQDVNDRWAIVAYVRALQLAQSGKLESATSAAPGVLPGPTVARPPVTGSPAVAPTPAATPAPATTTTEATTAPPGPGTAPTTPPAAPAPAATGGNH
jgi:mono/diheme cytochrome c family protein